MTDRVKGFWVALDEDIRTDDFEAIQNAVLQIKHVQAVETSITDAEDWINRKRVKLELAKEIIDILYDRKNK